MQIFLCILYNWRKLFRFIFVCNKIQIVILNLFIKMANYLYQQISYEVFLSNSVFTLHKIKKMKRQYSYNNSYNDIIMIFELH